MDNLTQKRKVHFNNKGVLFSIYLKVLYFENATWFSLC